MIAPEDQDEILKLVTSPSNPAPRITKDQLLRHFNSSDGKSLSLSLLDQAIHEKDADGVELSLIVASQFGIDLDYIDQLVELAFSDWHYKHEDVASMLGEIRSPEAVAALTRLAEWVPDYLEFDSARALANKAVRALEVAPGADAQKALTRLTESTDEEVANFARRHLKRRLSTKES
ncbi:hypothetical protein [Nocardia sp. MW-W600-9]